MVDDPGGKFPMRRLSHEWIRAHQAITINHMVNNNKPWLIS